MNTLFNVLITSASKKIPLVKAVIRALETVCPSMPNQLNLVYGGDCDFLAISRFFVDEFWHMPMQDVLTIEEVIDYCTKHQIKAIIPTRDGELPFFSRYQEKLATHGIHCLTSSYQTVGWCRNKHEFYTLLAKHHLPAIPTFRDPSEIKAPQYVVKECYGAGSISVGLGLSLAEAREWGRNLKEPIYQPYIIGTEYSVDLYVSDQGVCLGSIAREREVVRDGESQVTASVRFPEIESLCRSAAAALNIRGAAVFQVLCDQSKHLHIIECNPRFGGASTLSVAMGLMPFEWFFQEAMKRPLLPFERLSQELRQIRYAEDLIIKA